MNLHKLSILIFLSALQFSIKSQTITLHPMIHSIGIEVNNISTYNKCEVNYKKSTNTVWLSGHEADSIIINNQAQFRGSLFLLDQNTNYDVQVVLTNLINNATITLPTVSITTLTTPTFNPTANVKWVSPSGSGTSYTETSPGSLPTLLSSGAVTCGTTIMLKDGIYNSFDLSLNITTNCTEATPIQFLAASGAIPVFDGAYNAPLTWTQHPTDSKLFSASLPVNCAYSNVCILNNVSLYPYPSLTANPLLGGYNLTALNFGWDGYIRDGNTVYIKTQAGINPNNTTVTLSQQKNALTVYGNNKNAYLKFKGITFKHFAKPTLNNIGDPYNSFGAIALDIRNTNQTYFDNCKFEYNSNHLNFVGTCSNVFIQNCQFKDETGKWSHAMIKKSHDYLHSILTTVPSSRARSSENGAIFFDNINHLIVKNNYFDGISSGVVSQFTTLVNTEVDIYDNTFVDNFDAIECDGNWSNLRVWNNEIIRPMAGISAAPPLIGPRYFYRNLIHNMRGRRNEIDDPYYIGCQPVQDYKSVGIGLKTNVASFTGFRGNMYLYNNTFYSNDTLGFSITNWDAEWRKLFWANNIFYDELKNPLFFHDLGNKAYFHLQSLNDNYYTNVNGKPLTIAKPVHGAFNCQNLFTPGEMQNTLRSISGSNQISFTNAFQTNPLFSSLLTGGFQLQSNSTLIDKGVIIKGFYDYNGTNPDIGAKETGIATSLINSPNSLYADILVFPNPAQDIVYIQPKTAIITKTLWQLYDVNGKLIQSGQRSIGNGFSINVKALPKGFYTLKLLSTNNKNSIKVFKIVKG